jgi:hypothetical protein
LIFGIRLFAAPIFPSSPGNHERVSSTTGQAQINLPATAADKNELDFVGGITDDELWFVQSGNDLKIDLIGTNTQVTVVGWFAAGDYRWRSQD